MVRKYLGCLAGFGLLLVLIVTIAYFYPGSAEGLEAADNFEILAHRGVHTNWQQGAYDLATGCEATHMFEPTTEYIENTLDSIGGAFELGATMVEIDIRPTKDGVLMINHEENLECKTDGAGKIYDHTVEELKQLDVGYGFTADGGQTYPYRGKGVGLMPTIDEVFAAFPDGRFLIDHKDRKMETAELLVEAVKKLSPEQRANIFYWGSPEIGDYITGEVPEVTRFFTTRVELKGCITTYMLTLGFDFGDECADLGAGMNREYARYMWGFPYRFIHALKDNNTRIYLWVDNQDDIEWARDLPVDGIITDYIELVGPAYRDS